MKANMSVRFVTARFDGAVRRISASFFKTRPTASEPLFIGALTENPFNRYKSMKTKSLLLSAAFAAIALAAQAQSGGNFDLKWSTIDSGGGASSGGQFSISGTVGQPDAGKLAGGLFTLEGGFWSGVSVVQTPGAPILKIKLLSTGQALISWPVNVTGFTLQEATSASNPTWNNTAQAVVDTQAEHTVTVPASGVIKVFRLKK
jgi:hypothetical protein